MVSVVVLTITVTPVPAHDWLQPVVLMPSVLLIIVVIASLTDGRSVREDSVKLGISCVGEKDKDFWGIFVGMISKHLRLVETEKRLGYLAMIDRESDTDPLSW